MKRNEAVRRHRLLLPITDKENSSFFVHVINCVNNDEVFKVARNDNLMMTFSCKKGRGRAHCKFCKIYKLFDSSFSFLKLWNLFSSVIYHLFKEKQSTKLLWLSW